MRTLLSADALRAARALAGLSQREAASRASVTQRAVWTAEGMAHGGVSTNLKLRTLYEALGIEFLGMINLATGESVGLGVRWRMPPQLPVSPSIASSFHATTGGLAFAAARALLNKKQSEVAQLSLLSERKISALEAGMLADQVASLRLRSFYEQERLVFLGWGAVSSGLHYGVGVKWAETPPGEKAAQP